MNELFVTFFSSFHKLKNDKKFAHLILISLTDVYARLYINGVGPNVNLFLMSLFEIRWLKCRHFNVHNHPMYLTKMLRFFFSERKDSQSLILKRRLVFV